MTPRQYASSHVRGRTDHRQPQDRIPEPHRLQVAIAVQLRPEGLTLGLQPGALGIELVTLTLRRVTFGPSESDVFLADPQPGAKAPGLFERPHHLVEVAGRSP